MNDWRDKSVLVLGLGASGLAMARWCVRHGAQVTVADTREQPPQLAALQAQCPGVAFVGGVFDARLTDGAAWARVLRSPGLAPQDWAVVREWADQNQVPVWGELDVFAQALADLSQRDPWPYRPHVLAITGTNGKTTVTSLTAHLLAKTGAYVAVAGNIGPNLLDVLSQALDHEAAAAAQAEAQAAVDVDAEASLAVVPDTSSDRPIDEADSAEDEPITDVLAGLEADALPITPPVAVPPAPPHLPSVWVLELSSFQLDGVDPVWRGVPTASTVLNLSEDHLDWHGSMAAYAGAKAQVFGEQALMVLNRDDPAVMRMAPPMVSVKVAGRYRQQPARPWNTFGLDVPNQPGDWGIETVNGMDWLVRAQALDETRLTGPDVDCWMQRLMPADALRIRGRHNAANALAALALATSTGHPMGRMLHGLREYRGEPHRVEAVGVIHGVTYFDDSKGTNVGATLAAINGLGPDQRLVVILGGEGKGQDFSPLAQPLASFARAVVFIGRDAQRLREAVGDALDDAQVPMGMASTLPEAVRWAAEQARHGDAVLLSPACASLDMFRDYAHRAEVFVQTVGELALDAGVDLEVLR
ncbi:MAG: UDP-N-acetylmuramoyl-L-alanine--D-glutamate ligase [Hydrogenophaga sp.]|nr:UDP-N-acetylmuramoyl-L-alanine--D-glutamate ligase [Hydrogenophaga sp.]